jgi:Flp pilus assembly protein TadD
MQAFAKNRQILLLRAVVLEQARRGGEAESLLERIQNGWPEWQVGWLAHGIILAMHGRSSEARAALSTALALGSQDPQVRHYLQEISAGREAQPPDLTLLLLSKPSQDR